MPHLHKANYLTLAILGDVVQLHISQMAKLLLSR
jgi:hypothetical protein